LVVADAASQLSEASCVQEAQAREIEELGVALGGARLAYSELAARYI
jgi:hypothetical protein